MLRFLMEAVPVTPGGPWPDSNAKTEAMLDATELEDAEKSIYFRATDDPFVFIMLVADAAGYELEVGELRIDEAYAPGAIPSPACVRRRR